MNHIKRIAAGLEAQGLDAMLMSSAPGEFYATGFHGEGYAIIIPSAFFALFHGNFYQFFYAAGLGALLAYIYCVYGKLRYTIIFHAVVNFMGAIIPMIFEDTGKIGEIITIFYSIGYIVMTVFGTIFLIKGIRRCKQNSVGGVLEKPIKACFLLRRKFSPVLISFLHLTK